MTEQTRTPGMAAGKIMRVCIGLGSAEHMMAHIRRRHRRRRSDRRTGVLRLTLRRLVDQKRGTRLRQPPSPGCPCNGRRVRVHHGQSRGSASHLRVHLALAQDRRAQAVREGDAPRLASPETGLLPFAVAMHCGGIHNATVCGIRMAANSVGNRRLVRPLGAPRPRAGGTLREFKPKMENRNNRFKPSLVAVLLCHAAAPPAAHAAHPLNTDDIGVQGAGNFQLETTFDDSHDHAQGVRARLRTFAATLSYGIADSADLVVSVPYLRSETRDDAAGGARREHGAGDAGVQLKWRFYDEDGLSFALKPGMTFGTGDADKCLGAGKAIYSALLIASLERDPWSWHFNLGYTRNNSLDSAAIRKNLFTVSGAFFYQAAEGVRLVGDIGKSTNGDRHFHSHPAYVLGGAIFSPRENVDFDLGIQFGLNEVAPDHVYKAGVTIRW